ncbi:uncharacterized protein PgNI_03697 [Pyricularia grisea]|uniref:Cyanovirin-N domain-containing protein n=1 Tax=Pyricularia grisea TaxID=148305 RepID=A0A6P8BE56_PYRGI|nr:uncharacterized protein PgNI_03697 [Pyricularia grisea]TLD13982.1 hypothetical protein PgNI_03697 [Pyricularia grisea]
MQFKTIVVSLGLFALHASATRYCQVELHADGGMGWIKLQDAILVRPGRAGKFLTDEYTVNLRTDSACNIKGKTLEGRFDYEDWKLTSIMVDV